MSEFHETLKHLAVSITDVADLADERGKKLKEINNLANNIFVNADRIRGKIGTGEWRDRQSVKEDALKIKRLCSD